VQSFICGASGAWQWQVVMAKIQASKFEMKIET